MERESLPSNYDYLDVSRGNDKYIFRVKQIRDEPAALAWLKEFSDITKRTWRISRSFPKSGRYNIFKLVLRCVHNTDRRVSGKGSSKHTGCPATMIIVVKRVVANSKAKKDQVILNSKYPTIVTLKGSHNHAVNTAASLKHRDLSEEVKNKFIRLFREGHGVASAIQCHKTELMREYGDEYVRIAADGKYLPSYSVVDYLFKKELKKEYGEFSEGEILKSLQEQLTEYCKNTGGRAVLEKTTDNEHYYVVTFPLTENSSSTDNSILLNKINQPTTSNSNSLINVENPVSTSNKASNDEDVECLSANEKESLQNFFRKIEKGVEEDPNNYVPAVREMLKNISMYAKTETGLLSGLHTFATCSQIKTANQAARKLVRQSHKSKIGVQPTAVGWRKFFLPGKKKASVGRPGGSSQVKHLKEHDHPVIVKLPSRKRKAIT